MLAAINRFQAHPRREAAHPVATDDDFVPAQKGGDPTATEEGIGREDLVDLRDQLQHLGADLDRRVVERRPVEIQQLVLATDADIGMVTTNERLFLGRAQRLSSWDNNRSRRPTSRYSREDPSPRPR